MREFSPEDYAQSVANSLHGFCVPASQEHIVKLVFWGFNGGVLLAKRCLTCSKDELLEKHEEGLEASLCRGCFLKRKVPHPKYALEDHGPRFEIVGWAVKSEACGGRTKGRYNYAKVLKRDGYVCRYCGYDPRWHTEAGQMLPIHVDHIVPVAATGRNRNTMNNLATACARCNLMVGAKVFPDFIEKKAWILDHREGLGLLRSFYRYQRQRADSMAAAA